MSAYLHIARRLPLVVPASCSGVEQQGASITTGASVVETTEDTLFDAVDSLDGLYESLESADVEFLNAVASNPLATAFLAALPRMSTFDNALEG